MYAPYAIAFLFSKYLYIHISTSYSIPIWNQKHGLQIPEVFPAQSLQLFHPDPAIPSFLPWATSFP